MNLVAPSLELGIGMTTWGHDCTTHEMPEACILG